MEVENGILRRIKSREIMRNIEVNTTSKKNDLKIHKEDLIV